MPLSPRLKWKITRYSQEWQTRREKLRNFFKSVSYKQKMCPACRALVDRNDKKCPFCGENTASAPRGGSDRVLSRVMPSQAKYTSAIMTVNVLLFAMALAASFKRSDGGFDLSMLLGSIDSITLVRLGAKYGPLLMAGEWWRFITPVFLHGSILHIAFNSFALMDLGPAVEQIYGSSKFLALYVLTGAAGFVLSFLWRPMGISVGASGAIFGLIGAMIGYGMKNRTSLGDSVKSMYIRWAVYGLIYGFIVPGIDNSAHIGGLAVGFLFGYVVSDMPLMTKEAILFWKVLRVVAMLAVLGSFILVGLRPPI